MPLTPSILMHASCIWQTVQNVSTYTSLTLGALSYQRTQALSLQSLLMRLMYLYLRIALRSTWDMMHDGSLVRLLAGLSAFPLRWPAFGAEVWFSRCVHLYRVRSLIICIWCALPLCGKLSACALYGYSMMELCLACWNGCDWTSLRVG